MKNTQAAKSDAIVLSALCKLIPQQLVAKISRKYGVDKQARTFSPWSHVMPLLYAQLIHAIGLNDVCDGLTHNATQLATIRGATPPAKNTLSHANKTRDSDMMEELFREVLKQFQKSTTHFGNRYKGLPKRFKKAVSAIESSTIALGGAVAIPVAAPSWYSNPTGRKVSAACSPSCADCYGIKRTL